MAKNERAEALAKRIEQGAAELAAFAEKLSDADWRRPCNDRDRRPIGVLVHHVATMYPIEVDVAKTIAAGKAIEDVTWEAVAGINAKHSADHEACTRAEALELLRQNSRAAAAAVRAFTDAELDQAAPFSLSYGAPMTAQFVIEDHALRHPWHHLARMKKSLGR
jgi:hypothetical protein